MKILLFLDILSELIQLVFEIGVFTRKHIVPAIVYMVVWFQHYIYPALLIPMYYIQVRKERLSLQATA